MAAGNNGDRTLRFAGMTICRLANGRRVNAVPQHTALQG
jgi:hypothetical protein